jgi:hypothetical protein
MVLLLMFQFLLMRQSGVLVVLAHFLCPAVRLADMYDFEILPHICPCDAPRVRKLLVNLIRISLDICLTGFDGLKPLCDRGLRLCF